MKAIETRWKGYRFRSRTEARWAVFFETAGIDFEYEPEGYILPSGPYLPDFRLRTYIQRPSMTALQPGETPDIVEQISFLEVKGVMPSDDEVNRCGELQEHLQETISRSIEVMIAIGAPDVVRRIYPVCGIWDDENDRRLGTYQIFADEPAHFATAGPAGRIGLSFGGEYSHVALPIMGHRTREEALNEPQATHAAVIPDWMRTAYDAARSARFEFGQTDQRWPG